MFIDITLVSKNIEMHGFWVILSTIFLLGTEKSIVSRSRFMTFGSNFSIAPFKVHSVMILDFEDWPFSSLDLCFGIAKHLG